MLVSALTDDGPLFCHWAMLLVRFHFHSPTAAVRMLLTKKQLHRLLNYLYCLLLDCVKFKVQHV